MSNTDLSDGDGWQALDANNITDAFGGSYVLSGCDVTVNTGSFGDANAALTINSGQVVIDDSVYSVTGGSIDVNLPDAQDPRRDLVYLDGTGSIPNNALTGSAEARVPDNTTGTAAERPAPPSFENQTGVPLAEVDVLPSATVVEADNLTDRRMMPVFLRRAAFNSHVGDADAHHAQYGDGEARAAVHGPASTISGAYTAATQERLFADSSGSAFPVEMPPPSIDVRVQVIRTTDDTGNTVTIESPNTETINGLDSYDLGPYDSATVVSDGTNYFLE